MALEILVCSARFRHGICYSFYWNVVIYSTNALNCASFWEKNYGKISAMWALSFYIPFLFTGVDYAIHELVLVLFTEYFPFIILLFSLYTISGGILLKGSLVGSPKVNLGILFIGTMLSSLMGTTGSAMLLIRPLLRANKERKYKVHTVVFFIFLVANIGGSLTPLGDPPLFLGFLEGINFSGLQLICLCRCYYYLHYC